MNVSEKIRKTRQNIWQAIEDYGRHLSSTILLGDVSSCFVDRLAEDSVRAKQGLREMFRKSPVWDEEMDALVINGTRTHDPDYGRVESVGIDILSPVLGLDTPVDKRELVMRALTLFTTHGSEPTQAIAAIEQLAPKAYAPNKKKSRIFKALCKALGLADETAGSKFQRLYAQFADELSAKKINFKLFVSLNPAHFLTMSNPKHDLRGEALTSCHSFNSTDYAYNNGCSGYARDDVTMIAFTASDPSEPETLNNRKTTRQLFMYRPENGLLLQSRMYNTSGGTVGAQYESKVYRDLIQREISECENAANLWKTFKYCNNDRHIYVPPSSDFGGYSDWTHTDFAAVLSLREDCAECYTQFEVGTSGLCICCGEEIREGLYCDGCAGNNDRGECDECGEYYESDEMRTAYDRNGRETRVCEWCLDEYYGYCEDCGEYVHRGYMTRLGNSDYVCNDCLERNYVKCGGCGEYYHENGMYVAVDRDGDEVCVCDGCRHSAYLVCDDCGRCVAEADSTNASKHGNAVTVCPACLGQNYAECGDCGTYYHEDDLADGICPDCKEAEDEAI